MTAYLNEEEQLQLLKRWWNEYGNVLVSVILLIALAFASLNWWKNRTAKINTQASALYEQLISSMANEDKSGVSATSKLLVTEYTHTVYASLAALFEARQAVHQGDLESAVKSLLWAQKNSPSAALKQIATIRLARIYIAQGQLAQADHQLSVVSDKMFQPLIEEVQGDLTLARGQPAQARDHYVQAQLGLKKQNIDNSILQMKINSLPASV